ncbi:hypothetical protein SC1083_0981 [Aggregatibacter actinomycetemcomitans serotype e str. SC1083]|uniref:Uncharacterized protein n=1 Tax=Aggregatibacter actinomycetemcomitans serotype e str. SC1083 TaxID=907488 RepID=G4A834_AGGAC|nr:hypothetical protein SC1083_0981 [Aggregatibacter actinomycetemcomitans serotype e str. SC1083]
MQNSQNFTVGVSFALPNSRKIPYNPALTLFLYYIIIIMFEINPIKNKITDLTDRTSVLRGYL